MVYSLHNSDKHPPESMHSLHVYAPAENKGGLQMDFHKEVALCREISALQSMYDVEQYKMLYNLKDKDGEKVISLRRDLELAFQKLLDMLNSRQEEFEFLRDRNHGGSSQ